MEGKTEKQEHTLITFALGGGHFTKPVFVLGMGWWGSSLVKMGIASLWPFEEATHWAVISFGFPWLSSVTVQRSCP